MVLLFSGLDILFLAPFIPINVVKVIEHNITIMKNAIIAYPQSKYFFLMIIWPLVDYLVAKLINFPVVCKFFAVFL
jgi:hypothetical protein